MRTKNENTMFVFCAWGDTSKFDNGVTRGKDSFRKKPPLSNH
jgi:hypothetical protein